MSYKAEIRLTHIQILIGIATALLIYKIADLQLMSAAFARRAEAVTLDQEVKYPSRGLLYDRNGKLLVHNAPRYDLLVVHNKLDPTMDTALFCSLLQIERSAFVEAIEKDWSKGQYSKATPFHFMKNIGAARFAKFQEYLHEFPGFYPKLRHIREYPYRNSAHALGYISEVTPKMLADSGALYEIGDFTGIAGVENFYESRLRGEKGVDIVLKDNLGRRLSALNENLNQSPKSGSDIQLSIDIDLQTYAESLLQNKVGSIVMIDPKTGEIVVMASAPYYDPNILTVDRDNPNLLAKLQTDSLKPFFNRAVMAKYPPASIFKPILSLIAMQENVMHPYTYVPCPGHYRYETFRYNCHLHPRARNVKIALEHSCNSYFFQVFRDLIERYGFKNHDKGLDLLVDYLYDFGLGHALGVDVPNENRGFIPTSRFYDRLYPQYEWKSTYIMSIGIGQGELELTTVQMANLAAIIANRGYYITPHLIRHYSGQTDREIAKIYRQKHYVPVDSIHFEPVIEGLERAVRTGTAHLAYLPGVPVCGKTGTSQNPHGEDHSVFYAFAPKEDPKVAIAVYIENAGTGGAIAAPIASLMIEQYLTGTCSRPRLEQKMLEFNLYNSTEP